MATRLIKRWRRLISPDRVALTGSIIGLSSLLLGWLTIKPNRLAAGAALSLWKSFDAAGAAAIAGLWLLCLTLSLVKLRRWRGVGLGVSADAILALTFVLVGLASSHLLEGEPPAARVSPGAGFWVTIAGAYAVIFAARRQLDDQRTWQNLVSWSGLAFL
ncbi:MAG: hypothetical protein U1B77_04175, partial [Dehalococcoidales bacterium]|nr:hypothetical protein [Dehalococcoidales bacterium]